MSWVQENRKKKLNCSKCGKLKEEDDDITWITVNGNHIPIGKGEDKDDAVDRFFTGKNSSGFKIGSKQELINSEDSEDAHSAYKSPSKIDRDVRDEIKQTLSKTTGSNSNEIIKTSNELQNDDRRKDAISNMKSHLSNEQYSNFKRITDEDDVKNKNIDKVFNNSKYVYRGVSNAEFENIQKTGKMELSKNSSQEVIFSSLSPGKASLWAKDGVILKIDKEKLGSNVKPFHHSTFGTSQNFKTGLYGNVNELSWLSVGINPKGVKSDVIVSVYK